MAIHHRSSSSSSTLSHRLLRRPHIPSSPPSRLLTMNLSVLFLAALLSTAAVELATGEGQSQSQQSSPSSPSSSSAGALYHNHQMGSDESIDVSSSIGVSGTNGGNGANGGNANSADAKPMMLNHPGHVEDLLANESGEGDGPRVVAMAAPPPPLSMNHQHNHNQQPGLSHAVVVDSEHDLIGAETEPKFSLSKFKRPFARLPSLDSLRFNNRFLNGILAAGSNPAPQRAIPPGFGGGNGQPMPQFGNRQPGPPPPQHFRGPGPNFRNNGGPPPLPFGHPHPHPQHSHPVQQAPPAPVYKALNMPPGGGNGGGGGGGPKFNMPSTFSHAPLNGGGGGIQESYHVIEEPMTITVPSGGQGQGGPHASASDQADIMHSISDFIGSSENGRINSLNEGDLDQGRPMLSAPPSNDIWPLSQPELPKIVNLDVKCEKNFMKVSVEFDRPYSGMIFSKGHFSSPHCIHLAAGSGRTHIYFDIRMDSCGTTGNMGANSNALAPAGGVSPAGTFFENTVIFQYDPFLQEAWDQARKLRCTWHDQYEKSVSFRPFPVDMVDVVRADFAGDNVGCWMQIQVGRGPWASEVAGIVKIGQTMTMVLAIKDEENKFDMLVRNCVAHDGKRPPIELVDTNGCIVRSKLMSRFTKIKNFGSSASVLSYAHFQAFKFPDSMEVHFQCTIQICKHRCPEQCDASGAASGLHYSTHQISGTINTGGGGGGNLGNHQIGGGDSLYLEGGHDGAPPSRGGDSSVLARPREIRDVNAQLAEEGVSEQVNSSSPMTAQQQLSKDIGVNKVIRVVSSGDLSFATSDKLTQTDSSASSSESTNSTNSSGGSGSSHLDSARSWLSETLLKHSSASTEKICMSSLNFVVCFATLAALLLTSVTCSLVLCCRRRAAEGALKAKQCSSAKESILTAKMVLGAATAAQHRSEYSAALSAAHHAHYGAGNQTSSANQSNGGGALLAGAHAYLGSSSVLSPRVQASSNGGGAGSNQQNGYAHHRSSDLYHS